jgi:hypothetical protein
MAPMTTTPLMALEPDINGVCRTVGTFAIISNPNKTVKANKYIISKLSKKKP